MQEEQDQHREEEDEEMDTGEGGKEGRSLVGRACMENQ